MSLTRASFSDLLSSNRKISSRRIGGNQLSLRRFPFSLPPVSSIIPNYIEEVFSTYTYTGTNSTQSFNNGIDLSTYGGLVWIKNRDTLSGGLPRHLLIRKVGASYKFLQSDNDSAEDSTGSGFTSMNSNGFTIGADYSVNENTKKYVSWTFRKKTNFFDVVTYTGNGLSLIHI